MPAAGTAAAETAAKVDGRTLRRSLAQTGRYVRQPKNDPASQLKMDEHGVGYSTSGLVAQMRTQGNLWKEGDVTVKLAKAYGYCWGVERAVRMAYEARQAHPDKKLYITNEIIHNPEVNEVGTDASQADCTPCVACPGEGLLPSLCLGVRGCLLRQPPSTACSYSRAQMHGLRTGPQPCLHSVCPAASEGDEH